MAPAKTRAAAPRQSIDDKAAARGRRWVTPRRRCRPPPRKKLLLSHVEVMIAPPKRLHDIVVPQLLAVSRVEAKRLPARSAAKMGPPDLASRRRARASLSSCGAGVGVERHKPATGDRPTEHRVGYRRHDAEPDASCLKNGRILRPAEKGRWPPSFSTPAHCSAAFRGLDVRRVRRRRDDPGDRAAGDGGRADLLVEPRLPVRQAASTGPFRSGQASAAAVDGPTPGWPAEARHPAAPGSCIFNADAA